MGTSTGLGGLGGFAEGDLIVVPGQTLQIFVGGRGITVADEVGGGGFNGGGDARSVSQVQVRGGGGGASDVRVGGITFNDRVIVAGGAGGGCGNDELNGGDGGGLTGGEGTGNNPAGGGTQTAGGTGVNGFDGEFGLGGNSNQATTAGGGGGWFGGGSGCGGGGGSSYIDGVENGNTTSGIREGDGLIVLTFTPEPRPIPTLSEWGLIAMAGVLGIIGLLALRRRRAAA